MGFCILYWICLWEQRDEKSSFLLRPPFDSISLFELHFLAFWSFFGTLGWDLRNFWIFSDVPHREKRSLPQPIICLFPATCKSLPWLESNRLIIGPLWEVPFPSSSGITWSTCCGKNLMGIDWHHRFPFVMCIYWGNHRASFKVVFGLEIIFQPCNLEKTFCSKKVLLN